MIYVSIESGDIDPFGYQENKERVGNFNRALPSMTSEVFEETVKHVRCKLYIIRKTDADLVIGKPLYGNPPRVWT
jgi:hypothetical protein